MMKMTKKNWLVVALGTATMIAGNLGTNYAIVKKNGYQYNKQTKQFEKDCAFGIDLETESQIATSNMVWSIVGAIAGAIAHNTIIDK